MEFGVLMDAIEGELNLGEELIYDEDLGTRLITVRDLESIESKR